MSWPAPGLEGPVCSPPVITSLQLLPRGLHQCKRSILQKSDDRMAVDMYDMLIVESTATSSLPIVSSRVVARSAALALFEFQYHERRLLLRSSAAAFSILSHDLTVPGGFLLHPFFSQARQSKVCRKPASCTPKTSALPPKNRLHHPMPCPHQPPPPQGSPSSPSATRTQNTWQAAAQQSKTWLREAYPRP